jgi:hypothetical protein
MPRAPARLKRAILTEPRNPALWMNLAISGHD